MGDEAYNQRDPAIWLAHNALVTKEWIEDVRRTRLTAGWMAFANCCWFRHVTEPQRIKPYPVYESAKLALADVLVSLDQRRRHWFAGDTFKGSLVVINDRHDGQDLKDLACRVRLLDDEGKTLAETEAKIPDCPYFGNASQPFSLGLPAELPRERADYRLELELGAGGRVIGRNEYQLLIASRAWAHPASPVRARAWAGGDRSSVEQLLSKLQIDLVDDLAKLTLGDMALWVGKNAPARDDAQGKSLLDFVERGGRLLLLQTGAASALLTTGTVERYDGMVHEFVNIERPEHAIFDGLGSQDLKWWSSAEGREPIVIKGAYALGADSPAVRLGEAIEYHSYGWKGPKRYPLFEIAHGRGRILVSELLTDRSAVDPLAARLLANMLAWGVAR